MKHFIRIAHASLAVSTISIATWSCSGSNFSGSSKLARPQRPQTENFTGETPGGGGGTSGPAPERNTSIINGQACVNEIPTVDVAMVIDRSSSMGGQIRAVRDGLSSFATTLRAQNLPGFNRPISNLRFTLVAYEDEQDRNRCPWFIGGPYPAGDPSLASALASEFNRANPGGSDIPEGGIMAIRETLQRLEAQPEDSVKIIVLVTDTYMHDGTGSQDSRYGGFATLDGLFASARMKNFMLFSSSSTSGDGGGDFEDGTEDTYGNSGRGTAQIAALRNHYKQVAGLPNAYVGEEFTPVDRFNSSSLSNLVAAKIAANIKRCP